MKENMKSRHPSLMVIAVVMIGVISGRSIWKSHVCDSLTGAAQAQLRTKIMIDDESETEDNQSIALPTTMTMTNEIQMCTQKYFLFTDSRSGSTWTCSKLHEQYGISCGSSDDSTKTSEMMIRWSGGHISQYWPNYTWDDYKGELDRVFQTICDEQKTPVIGFKLMHSQIPEEFKGEGGQFEQYVKENNIAIIHLVREAAVLRLASRHDAGVEQKITGHRVGHSENATWVQNLPQVKMPWNQQTIDTILKNEEYNTQYETFFHFMTSVRYYYLSYEHLLTRDGLEDHLSRIISFLMPFTPYRQQVNLNETLLQLHSPTCSSRIENYDEFAKELELAGASKTVLACRYINELFGTE